MIFWLYSILTILMCWILYRLTNKSFHIIIFYILSLLLILFYFICDILIFFINYFKFRSFKKILNCNENKCKNCNIDDNCDLLCKKNNYDCNKDLFCKIENDTCVLKNDCNTTIENYYKNIQLQKDENKNKYINWLNETNIRKKDFDDYLKFYSIFLLFIFLIYIIILLLLGKITIEWSYLNRDLNYIRRKMTNSII